MKQKIFDLHLDLEVYLNYPEFLNMKFSKFVHLDFKRHGDIPQFKKAGLKLAVVNIFPFKFANNQWLPINFNQFLNRLSNFLKWINKFDIFQIIKNNRDLSRILKIKKIGIILGVEGLNFLNRSEDIYKLFEKNIRVFGLNWNIDSKFSTSLKTISKNGLTKSGEEIIKFLQKLPIAIDLAHSSIYTCYDVLKIYNKPLIFSHNGIKKIVGFEQNLNDKLLNAVKSKNGLIGLTFLPYSIQKNNEANFLNWYEQFKYAREKWKDILAIGTDFFGFKFNENYKGFINYIDLHRSIRKFKLPNYLLFNNAVSIFLKLL